MSVTVYADIVGDLFHAGHVNLLRVARSMGDRLVVGVHDDVDVESYKRRPVLTMAERMAIVEGCRYCDEVVPRAPLVITEQFLVRHAIDLVVHGDDIDDVSLNRSYGVPLRLGIMRLVPYSQELSTTDIIRRITSRPDLSS
jgi:cytidyltransferase-like protein